MRALETAMGGLELRLDALPYPDLGRHLLGDPGASRLFAPLSLDARRFAARARHSFLVGANLLKVSQSPQLRRNHEGFCGTGGGGL